MIHVVWGLVIANGKSEQMGPNGIDTAFLNLGGKPMLYYSIQALEKCPEIDGIAVVAKKERLPEIQQMAQLFGFSKLRKIAAGTTTSRNACLKTGLGVLNDNVTIVTVQDVSRPLVDIQTISDTVKTAKRYGCAIAAGRIQGSAKVVKKGFAVDSTLEGVTVWDTQSPMSCKLDLLKKSLEQAAKKKTPFQDEAQAVELNKAEVRVVPSPLTNIKISEVADLVLAESIVKMG